MNEVRVGDVFRIERRFGFALLGSKPQRSFEKAITRVTPKRAYFDDGDWFALSDPTREVKPRYLEYRTNAVCISQPSGPVHDERTSEKK